MSQIRFIAGSGRSGTTWIQDSLAAANKLRPVFEPLHPYLTSVGRQYAHRALSADEEHPALKEFLLATCAGHGLRLWTQYRQQLRWLIPPPEDFSTRQDAGRTKRHWMKFLSEFPRMTVNGFRREPLVKCIRANLMLPWLARNLACRIVLIVRHPGAVIESELRGRWNASFALDRFRKDPRFHELTGERYRPLLSRQVNQVEALAARWVIENQWVIEAAEANGISIVHYEHLRSGAGNEWPRLCSVLGLNVPPAVEILMRPSQQSGAGRREVPLEQAERPGWMTRLSVEQSQQIRDVLEFVGFSKYVMDEANPRRSTVPGVPAGSTGR
jgi:hypothetical protein